MLPRRHRLTRPHDFGAVLRAGRGRSGRAATRYLVVHRRLLDPAGATQTPGPRVGFVVSKQVGGSVVRHRVTRRLRAVLAPALTALPVGTDLVVRALPEAATATSAQLAEAVAEALTRLDGDRAAQVSR